MASWYGGSVRFLHILAGVLWIGGAILWSAVIMPRVTQKVAPPARGPFITTVAPVVAKYLVYAGYVTLLTGIWNVAILSGGWGEIVAAFQETGAWGYALGAALLLTIASIGVVHSMILPSLNEIIGILSKAPPAPAPGAAPAGPPPRMAELGKKMMIASVIGMVLSITIVALMATAVNVRAGP